MKGGKVPGEDRMALYTFKRCRKTIKKAIKKTNSSIYPMYEKRKLLKIFL